MYIARAAGLHRGINSSYNQRKHKRLPSNYNADIAKVVFYQLVVFARLVYMHYDMSTFAGGKEVKGHTFMQFFHVFLHP